VETLLRKYLWAVDLAVVALCSTFLGMAASGAVESKFASMPAPARTTVARAPKPETKAAFSKDPRAILVRNVFCSTCPPILDDPNKPVEDETVTEQETKTTLPIAVLAIMYAPPPNGMRWSVAVMRDTEAKSMGAFPVGGKIHGATVTGIAETRVFLDNQGKAEYIDLFELPTPPAPPPTAAVPNKDTDPFAADLAKGITKLGETLHGGSSDTCVGGVAQRPNQPLDVALDLELLNVGRSEKSHCPSPSVDDVYQQHTWPRPESDDLAAS